MPAGPTLNARPAPTRTRSSTIIGAPSTSSASATTGLGLGLDPAAASLRNSILGLGTTPNATAGPSRPRVVTVQGHEREGDHNHDRGRAVIESWTSPRKPPLTLSPSAPTVPTFSSMDSSTADLSPMDRANLLLYTYKPSHQSRDAQPAPLPVTPTVASSVTSTVLVSHSSLPWPVLPGDYLEIRRIRDPKAAAPKSKTTGGPTAAEGPKTGGEALRGIPKGRGHDGFVFRLGPDSPNVPHGQIQVPESVASAFRFQHRSEVEIIRVPHPEMANIDFIELRFSQYLGRADMWRLGMSLEQHTLHVGERVSLAGGAVRAEVYALWRGTQRYSSGIVTPKSKTIFRSRSAQVYIFIQLCQETWEFDEDGERYYEKVVHGFLPELFSRWAKKSASHLVSIILFARMHYDPEEVAYMEKHDLTAGLTKHRDGKWCKDFFRVVIDFERRSDWAQALPEIKLAIERSEREILLEYHLGLLASKGKDRADEKKQILGEWSFAYEGNILEAINLALNPFDEHYIDRDLSRTGLSMTVITPGTGHFAVDKALLRLTTERMVDHGIGLDLVCLTKMPLHSVPLFSYVTNRPKETLQDGLLGLGRPKLPTPDLLYFDAKVSTGVSTELADCYSISKWVYASYYSKTHDKPFRKDRFVPRCKMYEIQMLGILDHNLTTLAVPLVDVADQADRLHPTNAEDRKRIRDTFDEMTFGNRAEGEIKTPPGSLIVASYQSARLSARFEKEEEEKKLGTSVKSNASNSLTVPTQISIRRTSSTDGEQVFPPLELQRTTVRPTSPAPSSLSMRRTRDRSHTLTSNARSSNSASPIRPYRPLAAIASVLPPSATQSPRVQAFSPDRQSVMSGSGAATETLLPDSGSGQSTPRLGTKKLKPQTSRGSLAKRIGSNWLFSFSARSQPSFPIAAAETVTRPHVAAKIGDSPTPSPLISLTPLARPLAVPGAMVEVTPSTPSPVREKNTTQPLPITSTRGKATPAEDISRSLRNSSYKAAAAVAASRSPGDSWRGGNNMGQINRHVSVNPCNPKDNIGEGLNEGRRWKHIRPLKQGKPDQHLVKWTSLSAPAMLPLTTDYLPTKEEVAEFYSVNSYEIACVGEGSSFLVRSDAAGGNFALAVMREMASQRLSQNFQIIVHSHDQHRAHEEHYAAPSKILMPGEAMSDTLRVGGASEALRDANGVIYLILSHIIHRLACDTNKQSITIQRFVRKIKYTMDPFAYKCLVWPVQGKGYEEVGARFSYPISTVEGRLGFNFLDRLIAGEELHFDPQIRYWRTRYIVIPSGNPPSTGVVPKGEQFKESEILFQGAERILEIISRYQWSSPVLAPRELTLLPSTFDPSACVLDEFLMKELERVLSGEVGTKTGKKLEGMTLVEVGDMMNVEMNGLAIYDRLQDSLVHEDSFRGGQFCKWLVNTFDDVNTSEQAADWGRKLLESGLIEHVTKSHGFVAHGNIYYRLRPAYDSHASKRKPGLSWFGGISRIASRPEEILKRHLALSTSPSNGATEKLSKLTDEKTAKAETPKGKEGKKKITMSQSCIIDLDPLKKSDRAEMAWLHSDVIHNYRNALHFELNWVGVTAGLLDELRSKCSAQADRYGLRFVEVPVEQIKDIPKKCAYRAAYQIKLALEPPVIPDLHLRLAGHGTGHPANYFEYAILTRRFGFVLDVESADRYPENVQVEYAYRVEAKFEYSQFCHRSGLALVQCIGGKEGFLWSDNRLFIAAPSRGRTTDNYPNAPMARVSKQDEARMLRKELERFCGDVEELKKFYEEVTPEPPKVAGQPAGAGKEGEEGAKTKEREEGSGATEKAADSPELDSGGQFTSH